ncbi:unnamed protein product [Brugia pahangi]|uniref:Uncharacterized protein n=1 Tax=Brugia pahangi TaxID=6280 RepID=A0A0N4T3W7_BRUPA|nr:unnamed protein product [Brugia pahangi]
MNLITNVIITVLLSQRFVQCDECDVKLLKTAFPDPDYLIYGLREDRSILLLPSDIVNNDSVSKKLPSLLDDGLSKGPDINHYDAMLIEVHGLLQFITVWQEIHSTGKLYTFTRLSYFEAFRLVFVPTPSKIVYEATFTTLMYFSDLAQNYFIFKTTADNKVFFYQIGEGRTGSYQIIFGRAGTKLFIQKINKITDPWVNPTANLMAINKKTTKWLARRQKSAVPLIDCIAETKSKYGVGILYGRKNLVNDYYEMGDSAFDCKETKCKKELRNNGGKSFFFLSLKLIVQAYHDKEVDAVHTKGSIYLGFRNGYIFSYRVINEKEKFSEILFSLDLAHRIAQKEELGKDDELYLFSTDGKEAIVVICGPTTYYRIYNINPWNGIKVIYLKKDDMTVVKTLNKKCRKVDYNAKHAKLIFFIDTSTAHELKLTFNHDGVLKTYPDPKLNRFDNYRGSLKPFEGIESQWPLHLRNGRTLFYNEKYIELFRKKTEKYPISFYGVVNCTVFVILKFEDFEKVNLKGSGCDKSYKMRAILIDSYITVLRTKDGLNVEGVRIKVSIDYTDIEKGIKESGVVAYTHNLIDSEFEKNNSFTIAPNTFDTIHNIDEYTYYQHKPRTECTYHFRRRKITRSVQKDIKDLSFPALAVSYKKIMKYPCDFEMSSAMYDESVPGVVYVMRRKTEAVLVTPNTIITDTLKHAQNEKFLSNFIYSTSFPYVLYNDSKGASVLSLENPSDEAAYILHSEIEAIEERRNDTVAVTKAVAKQDFEKAAFGIESEIIERPEFHTQKCRLVNA